MQLLLFPINDCCVILLRLLLSKPNVCHVIIKVCISSSARSSFNFRVFFLFNVFLLRLLAELSVVFFSKMKSACLMLMPRIFLQLLLKCCSDTSKLPVSPEIYFLLSSTTKRHFVQVAEEAPARLESYADFTPTPVISCFAIVLLWTPASPKPAWIFLIMSECNLILM